MRLCLSGYRAYNSTVWGTWMGKFGKSAQTILPLMGYVTTGTPCHMALTGFCLPSPLSTIDLMLSRALLKLIDPSSSQGFPSTDHHPISP